MNDNLNLQIAEQLSTLTKNSSWDEFTVLRNSEGDPGYPCYIDDLDLAQRHLGLIPTDFLVFRNCKLVESVFSGKQFFPLSLWSCNATAVDLRNTNGMLFAYDTDLRGAIFDDTTVLFNENTDLPSAFKDCLMDDEFADFLIKQGALLDFPAELNIEAYVFGVDEQTLRRRQ